MKIKIPLMIQDPRTSRIEGKKLVEGFHPDRETFFLDGPISKRIAVLDFSPKTGALQPSARFVPAPPNRRLGWYETASSKKNLNAVKKEEDLYSPEFMQVSVFASVLRTMYMFEKRDTLGRPLNWAFNAPQLLVIPRAGEWANAFYHRDSHSLNFFYFPHPKYKEKLIYTCLSRDIVAHETGHAIIDGIAPDLFDSCTPQSLAIHEAIADLTALLMSFSSPNLAKAILKDTKGTIKDTTEFSSIAEQVGDVLKGEGRCLRDLNNDKNLNPDDVNNFVGEDEPHALSEVLSGALYKVMQKIHDDLRNELAKTEYSTFDDPLLSASGKALAVGADHFKRMIFRGLDYLPCGNVSFVDYARAMIAADEIAYPADPKMRDWIRSEFIGRTIIHDEAELEVDTNFDVEAAKNTKASILCSSDWAAYDFANSNRKLLCIPIDGVPFQVRPRFSVRKKYDSKNPRGKEGRECIFKVAWNHEEENDIGSRFPQKRHVMVGTTLVFDLENDQILARLSSAPPTEYSLKCQGLAGKRRDLSIAEYNRQRSARDLFLKKLAKAGVLKIGKQALSPSGKGLMSAVQVEVSSGIMQTCGMANMLHIMGKMECDE